MRVYVPEYDASPMAHRIHKEPAIAAGTTNCFIPFLCIHRTHLLPILYSSPAWTLFSFARVSCFKNAGDTDALLGLSCSSRVLKLKFLLDREPWPGLKDTGPGEIAREDGAGESDGEYNHRC